VVAARRKIRRARLDAPRARQLFNVGLEWILKDDVDAAGRWKKIRRRLSPICQKKNLSAKFLYFV
jgi:hypothetical protein